MSVATAPIQLDTIASSAAAGRGAGERPRGGPVRDSSFASVLKPSRQSNAVGPAGSAFSLPDLRSVKGPNGAGGREARLESMREAANEVKPFEDSRLHQAVNEDAHAGRGGDHASPAQAKPTGTQSAESLFGGPTKPGSTATPTSNGQPIDGLKTSAAMAKVPTSDGGRTTASPVQPTAEPGGGQASAMTESSRSTASATARSTPVDVKSVANVAEGRAGQQGSARPAGQSQTEPSAQARGKDESAGGERGKTQGTASSKRAAGGAESRQQVFIDRIARLIHAKANGNQTEARIQLDPPSLGHLRVHLRLTDDNVQLRLVTENEAGREMLRAHMHELQAALERHGLRVQHIDLPAPANGEERAGDAIGGGDGGDANAGRSETEPQDRPRASAGELIEPAGREEYVPTGQDVVEQLDITAGRGLDVRA